MVALLLCIVSCTVLSFKTHLYYYGASLTHTELSCVHTPSHDKTLLVLLLAVAHCSITMSKPTELSSSCAAPISVGGHGSPSKVINRVMDQYSIQYSITTSHIVSNVV
ncbi:hypothetical protein BsWGS_06304 [Bradybaena similaris]